MKRWSWILLALLVPMVVVVALLNGRYAGGLGWDGSASSGFVVAAGLSSAAAITLVSLWAILPLGARRAEASPTEFPPSGGRRIDRGTFLVAGGAALIAFLLGRFWPQPGQPSGGPAADSGMFYHQTSRLGGLGGGDLPLDDQGSSEPGSTVLADRRVVGLPSQMACGSLSVEEAIGRRRSRRDYRASPVPLESLGRLLWSGAGITDRAVGFRAAPSAGALYPMELYAAANDVAGLARGIYRYLPHQHALEVVRAGDFRHTLARAALGQGVIASAAIVLVLSGVFERTRSKYGERAYRYVLLEAGHIAENLYLQATTLGLGACAVGAFLDDDLNRLLGLDGTTEAALYLVAIGEPL